MLKQVNFWLVERIVQDLSPNHRAKLGKTVEILDNFKHSTEKYIINICFSFIYK